MLQATKKGVGLSVRLRKTSQTRPMMPGSFGNMALEITLRVFAYAEGSRDQGSEGSGEGIKGSRTVNCFC